MKTPNRDLLVLVKDEYYDKKAMEVELEQLDQLLLHFETIENIAQAHEVLDMKRYRVIRRIKKIQRIIDQHELKPFIFISNKN